LSSQTEALIEISVEQVLDVVGDFDVFGGASLGLVAWALCVEEQDVSRAWEQAQRAELLKPAGLDPEHDEQLWKLSTSGWAERRAAEERSTAA
jgi:hypothetical protein